MLVLTENSIVLVHGLRGHPFQTWASNPYAGDDRAVGPSSRRQYIRSFFKSTTPPLESNSSQKLATSRPQQVFWPREYLAEDVSQARVWTYGYNADVIGGLFQANNKNSVSGHGRDLGVRLERDIDNEVDPVFFREPAQKAYCMPGSYYFRGPQPRRYYCQIRKITTLPLNWIICGLNCQCRHCGDSKRVASERGSSSS